MNKLYFLLLFGIFALLLQTSSAFAYVSFTFTSSSVPATIDPGSSANLIITITNVGNEVANTAQLNVKSAQYINVPNSIFNLGSISVGGSTTVTVPISVFSGAPEGSTSIPLTVTYSTASSSGTTSSDNSVIITITKRPLLQIVYLSYDKSTIQVGNSVTMTIGIQNKGSGVIKDLDISIRNFTLPIVPADTDTERIISSLPPGQVQNVSFNILVNQNADTIVYSIPIAVSFYDEQGIFHTDTKFVGLKVTGVPDFVVSVEKLDTFFKGSNGKITISVANSGSGRAYYLTSYTSSDLALTPNVNYIGNTNPDDTNTINLDANLAGATTGQHKVNVTLNYKDSYNEEFSKSYILDVNVEQKPVEISSQMVGIIVLVILGIVYWKRHFFSKLIKRK